MKKFLPIIIANKPY